MELNEIPEKIRDWIGSEEITNLIIDLNGRINTPEEKISVIPRIVFRVATKTLPISEIRKTLAEELGLDSVKVDAIANEFKEKILKPIDSDLRKIGVDIQLITENETLPRKAPAPEPVQKKESALPQTPALAQKPSNRETQAVPPQQTANQARFMGKPVDLREKQPEVARPGQTVIHKSVLKEAPKPEKRERAQETSTPAVKSERPDDKPFIISAEKKAGPSTTPAPPETQEQTVDLSKPEKASAPQEAKTKKQSGHRVVHYSGPVTKIE
jgi:hypothetical protein